MKTNIYFSILLLLVLPHILRGQSYPDQFYVVSAESLEVHIESSSGIIFNPQLGAFELEENQTSGYVDLVPGVSDQPFNRGLPSWNGSASGDRCSFKIQMRFPYGTGWSPWLTVGYWKVHLGGAYGITSFNEGYVDIDYVKLSVYKSSWQFRILMTRLAVTDPSPTVHKLSFFASDSRTTDNINYTDIMNDNPPAIFIPTQFYYQYSIDDVIGGSICSPTSVSMALRSYDKEVDPYQFALDTYDSYWGIFGIWPRVIQNASEYGLDGAVTRYRTWSEAYDVLANNGRIVISVGLPLYSGHLMMLAGFTENGTPIVHDPARYNGYGYVYNKSQLSESWFEKGGIAYTFYAEDSITVAVTDKSEALRFAEDFILFPNYPNPFNSSTYITFKNFITQQIRVKVYDIRGRIVSLLHDKITEPGNFSVLWDASGLPSGTYFIQLQSQNTQKVLKAALVK